jgi:hypothetical protein
MRGQRRVYYTLEGDAETMGYAFSVQEFGIGESDL